MKLLPIKENLKYSIIIVSFNAVEMLARCIDSIYRNTEDFEIIIVDNDSKDGSRGYIESIAKEKPGIKFILNDENRNFSGGNNDGLKLAEGETIIILNSDCVVTPMWAQRITTCLMHDASAAMAGPVCNASNGRQQVQVSNPGRYPIDATAVEWGNQNSGRWEEAGVLYGWCIAIKRDYLQSEDYFFDERFTNSFDDNDLCMRARLKGRKLFIDFGTYIHHEGQATFRKLYKKEEFNKRYIQNGRINQDRYFDKYKWRGEKLPKLIAIYRIANCEKYVRQSLEQTSKFADEIICLFARSQDATKEIALSFPKVTVWEEWTEPEHPFDEQAERNWLLQQAIQRGADWVISIDGDEIYEDKFIDMVPALITNPNPQILAYWCNWRTIWENEDGVEKFRADGIFGGFQNYRFFKVLPGMEIKKNQNIYNHHCGSAPSLPPENVKWLNVRVKHLGYDSREQRKKKYDFYRKADPRPVVGDVGNADYHHLIDTNAVLKTYRNMNRVSVMSIVKNEEDYIFDMLANIEDIADEYVIVDQGSTDKTRFEIDRFAKICTRPFTVIDAKGLFEEDENGMLMNYSQAKNFAKSHCRYEWILNLDADEMFEMHQIGVLFAMIEEDVDAYLVPVVNYMEEPKGPKPEENSFSVSESMRLFRNRPDFFYSGIVHESLEDSIGAQVGKRNARVVMSPIYLHHRGYLKSKEKVRLKCDRYFILNQRQFEISGHKDPRALFNMALHLFNDGHEGEGLKLYQDALALDKNFWRSMQNIAYHHMEQAKRLFDEALRCMPEIYRKQSKVKEFHEYLSRFEFNMKKIG